MPLYTCRPARVPDHLGYSYIIKNMVQGANAPYQELRVGGIRTVIMHEGRSAFRCQMAPGRQFELDEGCTKKMFARFMAHFTNCIQDRFAADPGLYYLDVEFSGTGRGKSIDVWRSMQVGDYFYSIDIDNAYWQAAYKLGYLTPRIYDRYFQDEVYRLPMRLCFSFLSRPSSLHWYDKDRLETWSVTCDTGCLRNVYKNVRNRLYLAIDEARKAVEGRALQYTIDSIDVCSMSDLKIVKRVLSRSLGFEVKLTRCQKLNKISYSNYGSRIIFLK